MRALKEHCFRFQKRPLTDSLRPSLKLNSSLVKSLPSLSLVLQRLDKVTGYLRTYFLRALILRGCRSSETEDCMQEGHVRNIKEAEKVVGFHWDFPVLLH